MSVEKKIHSHRTPLTDEEVKDFISRFPELALDPRLSNPGNIGRWEMVTEAVVNVKGSEDDDDLKQPPRKQQTHGRKQQTHGRKPQTRQQTVLDRLKRRVEQKTPDKPFETYLATFEDEQEITLHAPPAIKVVNPESFRPDPYPEVWVSKDLFENTKEQNIWSLLTDCLDGKPFALHKAGKVAGPAMEVLAGIINSAIVSNIHPRCLNQTMHEIKNLLDGRIGVLAFFSKIEKLLVGFSITQADRVNFERSLLGHFAYSEYVVVPPKKD
jgi:hypothetical protein